MSTIELPANYHGLHWTERRTAREQYIKLQEGKCSHCGNPLTENPTKEVLDKWINKELFPPNFFQYPVHLHHNHDTGMTIGAIHNKFNAVLWQYHGE
jgi:hypothetical protein